MNHRMFLTVALAFVALIVGATAADAGSAGSTPASVRHSLLVVASTSNVAPLAPVGTGFTYQGSLKSGGNPANGQYDFQFTLYDVLTGGAVVGSTFTSANVTVANGLFTVTLDFGASAITGEARYMEIAVRQTGGGTYTTLVPRQVLTSAPYALSLRPGAVISGTVTTAAVLNVVNTSGNGVGIYGIGSNTGIKGFSSTTYGVYGSSDNGDGIRGYSADGVGVDGLSTNNYGVYGSSTNGEGVHGEVSNNYAGVYGHNISNAGIGPGVRGDSATGPGVYGYSLGGNKGVWGVSTTNDGVYGTSNSSSGVAGISGSGNGVYGSSTSGWAGYFQGNVRITGSCCSSSAGTYQIDDPLDPANKYLNHAAVQSPDMKTIYDGIAVLDTSGEAWVTMPAYFEALNRDFRYQLTPIGAPGRDLYVAQEVEKNRFKIAGGKAGMKVSWQVTGIRHDPYATQNPVTVEQNKPAGETGKYLHPEAYGQPEALGIGYEQSQNVKQAPLPVAPTEPGH